MLSCSVDEEFEKKLLNWFNQLILFYFIADLLFLLMKECFVFLSI